MGSKNKEKTQAVNDAMLSQERERLDREHNEVQGYTTPERHAEKSFADSLRGEIAGGYRGFIDGTGLNTGIGGAGGGGGVSAASYKLDPLYKKLEAGYNPLSKGIHESMGGYRDFARTGGITDENAARIRGNGVFDEFARTGGVSDADKSNIRSRGVAPIGSFYNNIKSELARRRNVTGGYGTGYDSANSRLSRDSAIASSTAARDTEMDISDAVRTGRFQGASALSDAESGLSSQIQQGRLAGLGGLTDIGKFGYGGLEGIAARKQSISNANAASRASASNANKASALQAQQYRDKMKVLGLSGLEGVYGSSPAELARYDDNIYRNRGMMGDQYARLLPGANQQQQQGPSGWDRAAQWANIGINAYTGVQDARKRTAAPYTY